MLPKIAFYGAARNVTGSCYMVETDDARVLVDCGLYQERKLQGRNWEPFPFSPETLDAVFLTHAHLDHSGLLPRLVRDGFKGKIYCTDATTEIAQIILLDSAHLQEEDAAYKAKRHAREGRRGPYPDLPLYTTKDAEAVESHFAAIDYESCVKVKDSLEGCFYEAGHVLGSATVGINITRNGEKHRILFSGDVGEPDRPIINDPAIFHEADYVVIESTYGNRTHAEHSNIDIQEQLCDCINETVKRGGNIVVPSFALERSQEILYHLNELLLIGRIRPITVYLDSPMAIRITEVFKRHTELFDREMMQRLNQGNSPFRFDSLKMTQTTDESKAINMTKGSKIIIAGSGMITGGRIKHHLANNITGPENTVLFTGYQAEGTPGRQLLDGAEQFRLFGQSHTVRARVVRIDGFSAHADSDGLLAWLSDISVAPHRILVSHGEERAATALAKLIHNKTGWKAYAPEYGEEIPIE
ncbi:MAG: MBL fold metallo-hydrolase [Dehalococcoidales bacterium]|nr:MBL fold metallo-hydrolase [Dehalococcoidales bacterium]